MIKRMPKWLKVVLLVAVSLVAIRAMILFPWGAMVAAAGSADLLLLSAAGVVTLLSLVIKGQAWHLLMKPVLPSRWRVAQEANMVGAAVNTVSITVGGEAARMAYAAERMGGGASLIGASIVWTRAAEGFGLAVFLSVVPFFVEMPAVWSRVQIAAAVLFWLGVVLVIMAGRLGLEDRLPERLRLLARTAMNVGSPGRLVLPVILALANWGAQWATFHLVLEAVTPVSTTASFAAMMAANLGGLLRLLPANVGIVQASMVAGLAPFGIPPEQAVAAGLLLQMIQVPPVLAIGIVLVGLRGLTKKEKEWTIEPSTTST